MKTCPACGLPGAIIKKHRDLNRKIQKLERTLEERTEASALVRKDRTQKKNELQIARKKLMKLEEANSRLELLVLRMKGDHSEKKSERRRAARRIKGLEAEVLRLKEEARANAETIKAARLVLCHAK